MSPRRCVSVALVFFLLATVSIAFIDVRASHTVSQLDPSIADAFALGTAWLDTATLRTAHSSVLGGILIVLGSLLACVPRIRAWGTAIALSGACCWTTHFVTSLLKKVFGRLRPIQLHQSGDWSDRFFAGGDSLPSGHTAFYFGLFLALAVFAPTTRRVRVLLLLPAIFIGLARIAVLAHFPSDVLTSIGLSFLVIALALKLRSYSFRSPNTSCAP